VAAGLGLGLGEGAAPAATTNINVSDLATGQFQGINFGVVNALPKLPCGACTYAGSSTAIKSPDAAPTLMPQAWPASAQSILPVPPVVARQKDNLLHGTFINGYEQIYDWSVWRRAAIDFGIIDWVASSFVVEDGSAGSVVAYHVKVTNDAPVERHYFVELAIPVASRLVQHAYDLIPGDNGGTYVFFRPDWAFGRSLVDLLVDGLPVWSNTSSYNFPDDYDGSLFTDQIIDWGDTDDDRVRLYLGKLAPAATFDIDYSVRTDSRASADCGFESHSFPPQKIYHCYALQMLRSLPASDRSEMWSLDFEVYAKDASGGAP